MERKRYAIFSAQFLPHIGGVEFYTNNLARELVRRGHEVVVVASAMPDASEYEVTESGVEVFRLPSFQLIGGRMPVPRRNGSFRRLLNEVSSRSYDGILVNTRFYLHSLVGLKMAKRLGLRPILCEHGSAYLTFGNALLDKAVVTYEHMITALVKRYSPDAYAVSGKGVAWLRTFGIEAKGVLSNSIDADAFAAQASSRDFRAELGVARDALLVSFVGRLAPEKGVASLLEAMSVLEKEGVAALLVMAGDGPLRGIVEQCGLENVKFVGPLDRGDVAALQLQADVFCLPSRSEGFSTALLEAASCGVAPVATDVGGVREIVADDSYGIVLANASSDSIAQALRLLASDRAYARQCAKRCAVRVRDRFSWAHTADAFIEACERARR